MKVNLRESEESTKITKEKSLLLSRFNVGQHLVSVLELQIHRLAVDVVVVECNVSAVLGLYEMIQVARKVRREG
jgi:hypothetical protein